MGICPSTPVCPSYGNCTITAIETPFVLDCGIEYFGGAISSIITSSVKDCVDSCATTDQCVAVSYLNSFSTCILRDASRTTMESLNPISQSFYANITTTIPIPISIPISPSIFSSSSISSSISSTTLSSNSLSTSTSTTTSSSFSTPSPKTFIRKSPPHSDPCPPQYAMLHPNGALYKRRSSTTNHLTKRSSLVLSIWSSHLLGPASNHYPHSPSLLPFPKFPNSTWSYTAHGTSPNSTWGAELSHHVDVEPYRSYVVSLWSRQGEEGNCKVGVMWCGERIVEFEPEVEEYALRSVLFGTGAKEEGSIGISVECKKGGEARAIVLGDAGMEIGWAG